MPALRNVDRLNELRRQMLKQFGPNWRLRLVRSMFGRDWRRWDAVKLVIGFHEGERLEQVVCCRPEFCPGTPFDPERPFGCPG